MEARRILGLVLLGLVVLGLGCTRRKGVTTPETQPDTLMPLAIGNRWTYRAPLLGASGQAQASVRFLSVEITGTREIDGEIYFVSDDSYYRNRDDGLFVGSYDEGLGRFFDDLFFKYPVADGEVYTYISQETQAEVRVAVRSTSVTVPAETFPRALVYEIRGPSPSPRFYFAPGVGLLKTENYDQPGEGIELVSYEIAGR